jgi:hypothetical protein
MSPSARLVAVKWLHTVIWALFAGAIVAIPPLAFSGRRIWAWGLIALVAVEVLVLVVNRMQCPLTGIAARYTEDRRANFDIFLPLWLARHNKNLFGTLYVIGIVITVWVSLLA